MVWPFANRTASSLLEVVVADAAGAVMEQVGRIQQELGSAGISALARLRNTNGLIAGYALGIASTELNERNQMSESSEKSLADTMQRAFQCFGQDIQITKHVEYQSYAFVAGIEAGGQECTNKIHNPSLWAEHGSRYNLLYDILSRVTTPYSIIPGVSVRQLMYGYGVRMDENLIQQAVNQLLGKDD